MKAVRYLLAGAAAIVALAGPAQAHRMWILPSTFTLSGEEQWVTVDGAVSNDLFFPNHVPLRLDNMGVTAPDGVSSPVEGGWTGKFRSAFDVKLDKQGTWKIGEAGASYFARWEEDGEPRRKRGSLADLEADGLIGKPGVEVMQASRRVETFVTLGAPSVDALAPTGQGLELVPVTHPNDVYAEEPAFFRFVLDGEPAVGLEVKISKGQDRYRDDQGLVELVSDENGEVSFTLEEPGRYWLSSSVDGTAELNGMQIKAMNGYVATFEVLAP